MDINEDKTLKFTAGAGEALFQPGESFGQYRIERLLGRGGMGEVYEAEHEVLGRRFALKLIQPEVLSSTGALERFRLEAKVMAQLHHPNILQVDDFGETDGRTWLRMPVAKSFAVHGKIFESLEAWMREVGRLEEFEVIRMLEGILQGLAHAHEKGVLHRDLKPSNILLDVKGNPLIADFGLVKLAGEQWLRSKVERSLSQSLNLNLDPTLNSVGSSTRSLLGTYAYMSPEQKRGEELDERSDLFAVGLMTFQLLTGEETPGMERASDLVEGLNPEWDEFLPRALANRKDRRYGNAREMLKSLTKLKGQSSSVTLLARPQEQSKLGSIRQKEESKPRPVKGKNWMVGLPGGQSIELVYIAPGEFLMGSPTSEKDRQSDEHQHRVRLTRGYWLGKTEVTQGQWQALMGSNPSSFKDSGLDAPVEQVSWEDATSFCAKLVEQERSANRMPAGYEYGLPTEAQWEYACRAGTTSAFQSGDNEQELFQAGWYQGNSEGKTHPVSLKEPNAWGLYDMHGNVWEWCHDFYGAFPTGSLTDPTGPTEGTNRVFRGGSWIDSAGLCRSAVRDRFLSGDRYFLGFRLALRPTIQ